MKTTREELLNRVSVMACEAGENGCTLLEIGLISIVRAASFSLPVRSLLASLATILLALLDLATTPPKEML